MAVWKVDVEGRTFYDTDLSLDDAEWICDYVGNPRWSAIHPHHGPKHTKAILVALVRGRDNSTYDEAAKKVGKLSIDTVAGFSNVTADDTPLIVDGLPDPQKAVEGTG